MVGNRGRGLALPLAGKALAGGQVDQSAKKGRG